MWGKAGGTGHPCAMEVGRQGPLPQGAEGEEPSSPDAIQTHEAGGTGKMRLPRGCFRPTLQELQ